MIYEHDLDHDHDSGGRGGRRDHDHDTGGRGGPRSDGTLAKQYYAKARFFVSSVWWASGGLDPTALLAKQYYAKARFSFFSGEHGTDGTVERQYYTTPAFSSMV